jgi:uncharacterized protein (DUF488 family)
MWRTVWTIGHSTRPIDEFLNVLAAYDIELVADVRSFPGSRHVPQYSATALESSLGKHGIAYRWIPALGGRRRSDPTSVNLGWRHPAFRAYADHIATEEFSDGLFELLVLAYGLRTAIMCAEVLWWRCHRRIIADYLIAAGFPVVHIFDAAKREPASLTPGARPLASGTILYEGAQPRLL